MLYSVGGTYSTWADPQLKRFIFTFSMMFAIAMVPIWFWRNMSFLAYVIALLLLVLVGFIGSTGMGAQRWIDLGFIRLQPSELIKLAIVMALAAYYDMLPERKVSRPFFVLLPVFFIALPTFLVLRQPDLGTGLLILITGGTVMYLAGVHWIYFATLLATGASMVFAVVQSRGTTWQLLKDYQFKRIDTFIDPARDPLGAGYQIIQSKIAIGSGGLFGKGFLNGSQSYLDYLPEKHTDFIFTLFSEEFGFFGSFFILFLYALIVYRIIKIGNVTRSNFGKLYCYSFATAFFIYVTVNMGMVLGLLPIVGSPLPILSYGGSSMMAIMLGLGIAMSCKIYKDIPVN